MHPLLQNKFIRFSLFGLGGLVVIFVSLLLVTLLNNSRSTGLQLSTIDMGESGISIPQAANSLVHEDMMLSPDAARGIDSSYYYPPVPTPDGYTSELESYETSTYSVSARTKELDALCDTLVTLKSDAHIHFKTFTSSLNNCYATFYVTEEKVEGVLGALTAFQEVEITRNTESVTRHKQQLESQTQVLEQQLASISRTLTATELQFDEIATFARSENDAATLSKTIREKLSLVEQLTQQKISLTAQLNNLYQQATDLNERIDVVQFTVSIMRANPINLNKHERQWDSAWEDLKDEFTRTLIGLTTFFGIFLLWIVRYSLYLLVLIVVIRGLWKFAKVVWKKW